MVKKINWFIVCLLFSIGITAQAAGKQYHSYKGLVMAGYQGWFNAPDDGANRGWYHYTDTMAFAPVLVRLTSGRKCRSIKNCIRRSSSLQTERPLILSLRTMSLR